MAQIGDDEILRLNMIEEAAREVLRVLDQEPWRVYAPTFNPFADEVRAAVADLRAALDAPVSCAGNEGGGFRAQEIVGG